MRTTKQIARAIAKTVSEIRKQTKLYKGQEFNTLLTKTCIKHNVNEQHIRTVAGWKSN